MTAMRKAYADISTGQLHYRTGGQGEALLLLHQDPQSSLQYLHTFDAFTAAGFQVIAPDVPGYGMSDAPDQPLTISQYAGACRELLDQLGIEAAVVVGHHTGASMACQLAFETPERVSRLVMHGLPWYTQEEREERLARPHMDFSAKTDGSHLGDLWDLIGLMSRGVSTLESSHMAALHTLWAGDKHWYAHHAAFSYDISEAVKSLRVPTMVVSNTGDILHFVAERLLTLRPDFVYAELSGGTSYIIRDEPVLWVDSILEFIQAN